MNLRPRPRRWLVWLLWACPVLAMVYACSSSFDSFFDVREANPITRVGHYERVLASWQTEDVAHFPNPLPEDAAPIAFFATRTFRDSGMPSVMIRLRLPRARAQSLIAQHRDKAEHILTPAEAEQITWRRRLPDFEQVGYDRLPEGATIMILRTKWTGGGRQPWFFSSGIIANVNEDEILLWAQYTPI